MRRMLVWLIAIGVASGCGSEPSTEAAGPLGAEDGAVALSNDRVDRLGDAETGRSLFIQKGCVICHAVNGVGGKAAPALDAQTQIDPVDPLEFAARMWRGAPAMVEFQSLELGYVIDLEADDLAHLAAFAATSSEQKKLSDADIPEPMRGSLLDERFWEVEDWTEFMRDGQEGMGEPPPVDAAPTPPQR